MTEYLDLDDVLEIARQAVEADVAVGDYAYLNRPWRGPGPQCSARMPTQICISKPPRCCTPLHGTTHSSMETNDLHGQPAGLS